MLRITTSVGELGEMMLGRWRDNGAVAAHSHDGWSRASATVRWAASTRQRACAKRLLDAQGDFGAIR